MKLNVTPAEFNDLKLAAQDDLDWYVFEWLGRATASRLILQKVEVVVRRDVPGIPWFTRNVERVEP